METSYPSPPPLNAPTLTNVRTWNALCHASALLGVLVHFPGHLLGPLIVWLVKRGESPEIDAHGKEALNFQISMLIYNVVADDLLGPTVRHREFSFHLPSRTLPQRQNTFRLPFQTFRERRMNRCLPPKTLRRRKKILTAPSLRR
jgi:hypothetical protein